MNRPGIPTVCQLAYEAHYRTSYDNPAFTQRRLIWDTAWREAERATALIRKAQDRTRRGSYDHNNERKKSD